MDVIQPEGWKRPSGYANGVRVRGTVVFVAGQIGWDGEERIVGDDLVDQVRQALANVVAVVEAAGAAVEHVARMTWYVADMDEYNKRRPEVGAAYRDVMGRHFPAMTLVEVSRLLEKSAKVEIEATAVIPE